MRSELGLKLLQQWEFLNQISSNSDNTVVGIVRNKPQTGKRIEEELNGRSNITILEADLTNPESIKVRGFACEMLADKIQLLRELLESC